MEIISKITTPLKKLVNNPAILVMCALLDGLFFVLYGFLTSPFFRSMENMLINISDTVSYELDLIQQGQGNYGGILDILFSPILRSELLKFVLTGIVVVLIIYALYNLIHGFCWREAAKISKLHKKKYLSGFFKVNIFWFVLLVIHSVIDVLQEIRFTINQRILGTEINPIRYFMLAIFVIAFYYVMISYRELSLKKVFQKGMEKKNFYAYLYLIGLFFAINLLMTLASNINSNLNFVIGLVIFLPALTYARIFFLSANK